MCSVLKTNSQRIALLAISKNTRKANSGQTINHHSMHRHHTDSINEMECNVTVCIWKHSHWSISSDVISMTTIIRYWRWFQHSSSGIANTNTTLLRKHSYTMIIGLHDKLRHTKTHFLICLRSQTFRIPSSPPDTIRGSCLFHDITFTSVSCASVVIMHALDGVARQSHILIVWSTEQLANTCVSENYEQQCGFHCLLTDASFGLHCMSSTDWVWAEKGRWSTTHPPSWCGFHRCMWWWQSPLARRPATVLLQSRAYPSACIRITHAYSQFYSSWKTLW